MIDSDEFSFRVLGLQARRRHWRESKENDRDAIWPGAANLLRERLEGGRSFVVGAVRNGDGFVAARYRFSRSKLDPVVWTSGYLYTDPRFRKRSLGLRVTARALQELRARGGKSAACYIAADNVASMATHRKLGYAESGVVRTKMERLVRVDDAPSDIVLAVVANGALDAPHGGSALLDAIAERCRVFVAEEFHPQRALLPWKSSPYTLVRIMRSDRLLGFARTGVDATKLILTPEAFETTDWRLVPKALLAPAVHPLFLFTSCEALASHLPGSAFDHVMVHHGFEPSMERVQ